MSKKSTVCTNCEGTGNRNRSDIDPSPMDCPHCDGTGLQDEGVVHDIDLVDRLDELQDKLDCIMLPANVFYSHTIWEATDLTEFTALSSDNKDAYRGIVRMGTVSLVDGSHSRNSLWDMFDAESTTRAALLALLT